MILFFGKDNPPEQSIRQKDYSPELGSLNASLRDLRDEMKAVRAALAPKDAPPFKSKLITLTSEPLLHTTYGYAYFGIIVGSAQNLTINALGQLYTIPLAPGFNPINIFDGYTIAGTGYTCTLVWTNEQYGSDVFAGGTMMVGTDGTNNHTIKTDTSGNLQTVLTGSNVPISQKLPVMITDGTSPTVIAWAGDSISDRIGLSVNANLESFNGSTYDRVRNNTQGTLLASAARTATTTTSNQTNYNARGTQIILNVTALTTGNIVVQINGVDPVSGNNYQITPTTTTITATGIYVIELYPGASAAALAGPWAVVQRTAGTLPRTWNATVTKSDSSSWTYSVAYANIV